MISNNYNIFLIMSKLGSTLSERYTNFFKFFSDSSKSVQEINTFISTNSIKQYSTLNNIHLNMIDTKNLNILFHIIRKSKSDEECLEKMKLLIEQYNINYNIFDINRRTLPFYTCVKGYLNSTKYLLDKMNYNIAIKDINEETLFFSAIRSYNIELVKYLDNKYQGWIFTPNKDYNSCIFKIFKKSMKDEEIEKIKNIMKYIIERGFEVDAKNKNNVSFRDLCVNYKLEKYLNGMLKENKIGNAKNKEKKELINNINGNKKNIENSSKNESNINHNNKKQEKKNQLFNINSSSNHLKNTILKSNVILKNGNFNNDNKNNENIINTPKKKKRICCIFQKIGNNSLCVNNIYEKLASNHYMKEKYLSRMDDSLKIPSFEKGSISIIKKHLSKNE